MDSKIVGKHEGLMYYTIGQRKGLGIGGNNEFGDSPWFVLGKRLDKNELIVGQGNDNIYLISNHCYANNINWISDKPIEGKKYTAKFRYRQKDNDVKIEFINDDLIHVIYDQGVSSVTPGQAVVIYDGDICLGGGIGAFGLLYYLSKQIGEFFTNLFSSNDSVEVYENQVSINDVLSNPDIKNEIDKYGWSRADIIKWLEIMLGVSVDKFLTDNNIEVYLGSTEYELKYYSYRDTDNHKYAFYTENSWDSLVELCSGNYDMVWVLNMTFLQMCVMKNVTFVLVTPTDKYYKYASKQLIANDDGYFPFYSKELEFINRNGYCWDEFEKPNVRTRK